jgi:hypothetical protein
LADNVAITAGSGTSIATDDCGAGGHAQIVKLAISSDGSATLIDATAANGLEVDVTRVQGTVAVSPLVLLDWDDGADHCRVVGAGAHDGAATGNPVLIGAEYDDSTPDQVDEGDVGRLRISANRDLYTTLRDAAGNERGANVNASNQLSVSVDNTVTVGSHAVTNAGTFVTQVDGNALTALQLIDDPVFADDAAYTVGTSKVQVTGGVAVAHGSNPDAADAADAVASLFNRHRVQFVIGGHPNSVCFTTRIPAASGAQTDLAIGPGTVAGGLKVALTRLTITCSNANTVNVAVKVGFGATNLPADTATATGSSGIVADHEGVPPGGGFTIGDGSGILGVGADGEELRFTCDSPTSGHVIVSGTYYTIES